MNDNKVLIKKIIDFGYEYGLFSEDEDYQQLLVLVENKIDDLDFIINLYDVILKRVNKNNRIIYKNKKLTSLLKEVDDIRLKLNTDNMEVE
ncbi:MAG: hypothetical protein PHN42_04745 [Bacilli bacterium]|nr:hypothetical protein [Bacilli bacterium]